MVTITNDMVTVTVTRGAYENIYAKQGFTEVVAKAESDNKKHVDKHKLTDDEFVDKLDEKPISSWDKAEIRRYADIFGIDLSGTKNISEARDLIRDFKSEAK